MFVYDFGIRSDPPCGDCDTDGRCTMNCGPAVPKADIIGDLRDGVLNDGYEFLTDEADEIMKLAADEIDRLRAIIVADTHIVLSKRPVAWRVKDFADGWIIFQNENDANTYSSSIGAVMQGLYARDGK